MSGFLTQMAAASRARVREASDRESPAQLRARAAGTPRPVALALDHAFDLIAEYKRFSPALGRLAAGDEPIEQRVTAYARGGAAAVSVLTEPERFDGGLEDLARAALALAPLGIPVLRKDFLVDPYQLHESRAAGAGGVLLILRMLSDVQLGELQDCARELGLFVLLEAFDAEDIERAASRIRRGCPLATRNPDVSLGDTSRHLARGAPVLLGVNCRDLQTLEVKPFRFRELAPLLPPELPCVAESGIATPQQCADVAGAGYGVALVGGSLMSAADPLAAVRAMLSAGRTIARSAA